MTSSRALVALMALCIGAIIIGCTIIDGGWWQ